MYNCHCNEDDLSHPANEHRQGGLCEVMQELADVVSKSTV